MMLCDCRHLRERRGTGMSVLVGVCLALLLAGSAAIYFGTDLFRQAVRQEAPDGCGQTGLTRTLVPCVRDAGKRQKIPANPPMISYPQRGSRSRRKLRRLCRLTRLSLRPRFHQSRRQKLMELNPRASRNLRASGKTPRQPYAPRDHPLRRRGAVGLGASMKQRAPQLFSSHRRRRPKCLRIFLAGHG